MDKAFLKPQRNSLLFLHFTIKIKQMLTNKSHKRKRDKRISIILVKKCVEMRKKKKIQLEDVRNWISLEQN